MPWPAEFRGAQHREGQWLSYVRDFYKMLPELRTEVAELLREDDDSSTASTEAWPLLRVADRGSDVQAAQHLLRGAGYRDVVPDGRFDRRTADAVRQFQKVNGTEQVNGMIGGESWPLQANNQSGGKAIANARLQLHERRGLAIGRGDDDAAALHDGVDRVT